MFVVNLAVGVVMFMAMCDTPGAVHAGDVVRDRTVRSAFWTLLTRVRYGFSDYEAAAFIVRKPDGRLCAIEWPEATGRDCQTWRGAFPSGVVAIAHTHPNWLPSPSRVDFVAAQKTRLPVYVITKQAITRTDGSTAEVVVRGDWRPNG